MRTGELPLVAKGHRCLTASKEMGTFILQLQGIKLDQQSECSWEGIFPRAVSKECIYMTLWLVSIDIDTECIYTTL